MSPSHVFPTAFLVLTIIFILQSQPSQSIPPEQVQNICACTNATKDDCITIMTSNPAFKSAPDVKALAPLVSTNLSQSVDETLKYANSLVANTTKDPKLMRLYEGCAVLYAETNVRIHAALEALKAGDLKKVIEQVEESEFNVRDCLIGPKELGVEDPSNLWRYNNKVKALLDILTCVINFAS